MKLQNHRQPNESLKAERVQRADGSADAARPLKAERVQRTVKNDQHGKPNPPDATPRSPGPAPPLDVALHLQRLSGWRVDSKGALRKTFTSTDPDGARCFAEAIRHATADLLRPPETQRQGRRVQVTVPSPPEGLTETEFTLAAVIEDRWGED